MTDYFFTKFKGISNLKSDKITNVKKNASVFSNF